MGLPFNFFGFTELPFILQGSFLFDDDWDLDWRWSGYHTGINGDNYYLNHPWSGDYIRDVDPEQYSTDWKWSGRFSGVHDEFLEAAVNPYGEYTGILTEAAFLTLNWSGTLVKERSDFYHITNSIPHIRYSGILEEKLTLENEISEVQLKHGHLTEKVTLSHGSQGRLRGSTDAGIEETYTYSFAMNGIYQKDPSQ